MIVQTANVAIQDANNAERLGEITGKWSRTVSDYLQMDADLRHRQSSIHFGGQKLGR